MFRRLQLTSSTVLQVFADRKALGVGEARAALPTLAELYQLHAQSVARWAYRLGGPESDVEDLVQEVFVAVHQQLPRFRGASRVTTWLYAITANVVRDRRKKFSRRQWLAGDAEQVAGKVEATGPSAPQQVEQQDTARRVYLVLDGMKEKFRTVLILHEIEELSGEEIGELMGAKTDTVFVWLHRARKDFAARMRALEAEDK